MALGRWGSAPGQRVTQEGAHSLVSRPSHYLRQDAGCEWHGVVMGGEGQVAL